MDDVSCIKCYHFGHSFVTRLSRTIQPSGQPIFNKLELSELFNVVLQEFSGLTFDKVLSNPDRFLHQLQMQTRIDILSVDLESNDLYHPRNTVSVTIGKVIEFLQFLKEGHSAKDYCFPFCFVENCHLYIELVNSIES